MKEWAYEQIAEAASGAIGGTLAEWPYLREALAAEGISLPGDTLASSLTAICYLVLSEGKTKDDCENTPEAEAIQSQLLQRGVYLSRKDVCECYRKFCSQFGQSQWTGLDVWPGVVDKDPVDYIASMDFKVSSRKSAMLALAARRKSRRAN